MRDGERRARHPNAHLAGGARAPDLARSRADAAEAMIAMDLPVDDWEVMKAEIMAGVVARVPEVGTWVDRPDE